MAKFFIGRPIVAIVIAIIIVLGGVIVLRGLPEAQFPDIVPPQIIVSATYPGADALTVEQSVATPIEQQMNGVDNMLYMQSTNGNDNTMQLTVTFDVDTDVNTDEVNVQNRVAQATPNLPADVSLFGTTIRKQTGLPLMAFALYSPKNTHDSLFLANYANINIVDQLLRIPGAGQAILFGATDYSMRIWIKPQVLAKLGLTVNDLVNALNQQNAVNPAGQVAGNPAVPGTAMSYTVRTQGRLVTAEQFGDIIVRANLDGSVVKLKDLARIELGSLSYNEISRFNGQPSCIVAIFLTPGANAVSVADQARKVMAQLSQRFPEDLAYNNAFDTTIPVTEGIHEIVVTLFIAMGLVILVVYIFLQNWRATLIPIIAVPVSLIGTFAFFPVLGFSINTLSLFGLVLAIGLVVDDAIVVVEAVEHHIEEGMPPRDATLQAMREVSGPVVAIALILAAVFIPMAFVSGIQGQLNKQFAVTVAISVLISAFNALSLSPALAAMLLRPRKPARGPLGLLFRGFNKGFEKVQTGYVNVSKGLIRKVVVAILILLVFAGLDALVGRKLPTSFLPDEDYGFLFMNVQLPPAASLERTDQVTRKIEGILKNIPGVQAYTTIDGFSLLTRVSTTNNAFYFVTFKPWDERSKQNLTFDKILANINQQLFGRIPEAVAFAFSPPAIPGFGSAGGFSLWLQDRSGGTVEDLETNLNKFMAAARKRPELIGVNTQFSAQTPQIYATVDRDKVLKQGVTLSDVYLTLQASLGGLFVNQFNRFGRQWRVFVEAEAEDRASVAAISQYYVRDRVGTMVPLNTLVSTKPTNGPDYTTRFNLFRAAQIIGSSAPGYSSGQAQAALEEVAKETLPSTMSFDWADLSYQENKASGTAGKIFALSLLVVFLILAALYESWTLPFSVLLSVPIAILGAFAGLYLRKLDLDVYAQIGLVMLIGLAAKNAILIVEFARDEMHKGKNVVDAALEGAKLRLRPILMTSFAFILGCVPLAIATGSGAEGRKILGTVVVTGMLAATALAIFVIPVLFVIFERIALKLHEGVEADQPPGATPTPHASPDGGA
jgi:hydrophobic/amphiphilic exporter-1 (mainly G- bacteria), HAE1 family